MPRARSKLELKRELLDQLTAQLATARAAHSAATEGAISDDARPENDKDTRGLEQSYLARGHAQRVADLETALTAIEALPTAPCMRIALGALVTVEENDRTRELYIAGFGGGLILAGSVTVITPTSPMGRALMGKRTDDDCEVAAGGATRTLTIANVA